MVAFASLALAAFFCLASAHPAVRVRSSGVTHRVFAGSTTANGGLHFEPENVVAEPGDLMEFHFLPNNYTFTQSSFSAPCQPLANGTSIFSGFNFETAEGEARHVFSFVVKDRNPIWYYCSQTVGNHCQMGMSGVVNQDLGSNNTLAGYKRMARGAVTKQPSADLKASHGGWIVPNVPFKDWGDTGAVA